VRTNVEETGVRVEELEEKRLDNKGVLPLGLCAVVLCAAASVRK
jgi:hypothetical protein